MSRDIVSCDPKDSMQRVAEIMWERDCGCVPVVDHNQKLKGMITDRDIAMAAYTNGCALGSLNAERAMSKSALVCHAGDKLEGALKSMAHGRVRRLPVLDKEERLEGMLSMADVLQALGQADAKKRRKLADSTLDALLEITCPREDPAGVERKALAEGERTLLLSK